MRRHPPAESTTPTLLTRDDERELTHAIRAGEAATARRETGDTRPGDDELIADGIAARQRFVEANIGLVVHLIKRMHIPMHVDRNDVIQDGILGVQRALEDFDPDRGWKFSTYASWWIRRCVQQGLETTMAPVRIPTHRHFSMRDASERDLASVVAAEHATSGAVAKAEAGQAASVEKASWGTLDLRARSMLQMASLDALVGDGARGTIGDLVPADELSPEATFERTLDRDAVADLLDSLDADNAALVRARFGLDGGEPATYTQLARARGVTVEAVRRRVLRSLARLRPRAEVLVA